MKLLAAIPYLFEGRLKAIVGKPRWSGEKPLYVTVKEGYISFHDEDGTPSDIQAILGTDFGDLGKQDWEPVFYENQSELEREAITVSERYKSYSLLAGVEKLFNGELTRLESGSRVLLVYAYDEWTRELLVYNRRAGMLIAGDEYRLSREDLETVWEGKVGNYDRD